MNVDTNFCIKLKNRTTDGKVTGISKALIKIKILAFDNNILKLGISDRNIHPTNHLQKVNTLEIECRYEFWGLILISDNRSRFYVVFSNKH